MRGLDIRAWSRPARGARRPSGEAGFALVEVMVSAVLLLVLALATLPIVDKSGTRAGTDRSRSVASGLAQIDQERMRQMPLDSLANLRDSNTKSIDGLTYTVVSRADYVRDNGGYVTCTDNSSARTEYLRVRSTVTWSNMNGTKPVVIDSLVSPGIAGLDGTKGALTVKILNEAGSPVSGVTVTAAGLTDTTDAGGCAIFGQIPAGSQPITWNAAGYVTQTGTTTGSDTVTIVGAQTTIYSAAYDRSASVVANAFDTNTPAVASSWPVFTFRSGTFTTQMPTGVGTSVAATAGVASTTATGLYPFSGGYGVWAGNCVGSEPGAASFTAYPTMNATPAPGGSATAVPRLKETRITVSKTGQTTPYYYTVKPTTSFSGMNSPSGCGPSITRTNSTVAVASTAATLSFDLPAGGWTVCIDDNRNGAASGNYRYSTINLVNTPTATSTATATNSAVSVTMPTSGSGSTAASGGTPATTYGGGAASLCT
jgi:Tfp pilus assembly protein PilV